MTRRTDAAARLDATFAALAEPTRRQVVRLLRAGPRRAGEIADALGTSRQSMSRHLRVLREAGLLVEVDVPGIDDGRTRVYQLDARPLAAMTGWLDDVQAFWGDQLQAFKAHAERSRDER